MLFTITKDIALCVQFLSSSYEAMFKDFSDSFGTRVIGLALHEKVLYYQDRTGHFNESVLFSPQYNIFEDDGIYGYSEIADLFEEVEVDTHSTLLVYQKDGLKSTN